MRFQEIIKFIHCMKKYAEDNVWHDHTHLAVNDETKFYSEDIADFIIEELER